VFGLSFRREVRQSLQYAGSRLSAVLIPGDRYHRDFDRVRELLLRKPQLLPEMRNCLASAHANDNILK
jgi:hypothetical protein